jgi:hypothetical protein
MRRTDRKLSQKPNRALAASAATTKSVFADRVAVVTAKAASAKIALERKDPNERAKTRPSNV